MFDDSPAFRPEFERILTEIYGSDEQAKSAARADLTALTDHARTSATAAHRIISNLVWRALRSMGVVGGRMLILGQDPEIFAGLPPDEHRLPPGSLHGFYAAIPTTPFPYDPPHPGLRLQIFDDDAPENYDVALYVPRRNDVALHRQPVAAARAEEQTAELVELLTRVEPGGYLVALTCRDVMDTTDPHGLDMVAELGELVGALRLPSGALRPGLPGADACVDLLILRHHDHDADLKYSPFTSVRLQQLDGHTVPANQYWLVNPTHILGTATTRANPWGPAELVVRPERHASPATPGGLRAVLAPALDDIVHHARTTGLTYATPAARAPRPRHIHHVQHDDTPDAPNPYTVTQRHRLDDVRQRIAELRGEHRHGARADHPPGQLPASRQQNDPAGPAQ